MIPCKFPSDEEPPGTDQVLQHSDGNRPDEALGEARYRDFFNLAPMGYCILDELGLIMEANLAASRLLNQAPETLVGQEMSRFILRDDRKDFERIRNCLLETCKTQACELRLAGNGGTPSWVRLDATITSKSDQPPILFVALSDIDFHKCNEEQLKLAAGVFTHAREGIMITAADGTIMDVNASFSRITGYSRNEVIGQNPRLLSSGRHEKAFYATLWRDLIEKGRWHGEIWNRRKDGGVYAETLSISALRDPHGRNSHYVALFADITERKQAEEQMLETKVNLEAKVNDRTKQLRAVAAQLMMSEERERRMLAQELHDNLGQILAIIKIKLTSLATGLPQPTVNNLVELVDQADQAVRMITLNLSPPILHTLGLKSAFEWLAEEMEHRYQLVVHLDSEGEPRPIVDEVQAMLFRSARELLINVARHAETSEASLSFLCNESGLTLAVSDNGCGFDPGPSSGTKNTLNGFGLSSINERVVNIGGDMEIDSSPGNGTTITLTIPIAISATEHRP